LVTANINPLRYDLYGRGYSDRPHTAYGVDLFVSQLLDLLDALRVQAADLVGLSMGGVIASAFTVRHPLRVRRLTLIDPSGARALPRRLIYRMAKLPGIGELAFGLAGTGSLVKGIASDFYEPGQVALFQARYRAQMELRGFKRAILSTIRNRMLDEFTDVYRELAKLDTPIMLVWGQNDRTVPFEQSTELLKMIPRACFHAIPACGHIPHYEKPEVVNPLLIDFLQG
jgi:pimeloyl-ACP methyl ester carboxylesterase